MLKERIDNDANLGICAKVLILILMEHAQRVLYIYFICTEKTRLNPYFNGTCSKSWCHFGYSTVGMSGLNPYFNGTCSKSFEAYKSYEPALYVS